MPYNCILVRTEAEKIGVITLNRPQALNALNDQLMDELGQALLAFDADAAMKARYLRYLPEAAQVLPLDFLFFRVIPKRLRYIAGIGQMGWLEAEEWTRLPALSPDEEEALMDLAARVVPNGVTVLGVDRFGMDYRSAGGRQRVTLEPDSDLKAQILAVAPTLSMDMLN